MNIQNALEEFLNSYPIGHEFKTSEIKNGLNEKFRTNTTSIIPSDYCYNRINDGIKYEKLPHFFIYIKRSHYRYVGVNYDYEGIVMHHPKGKIEVPYGELKGGRLIKIDSGLPFL